MRTAIDTNVLSALWSKEPFASDIARNLGNAKADGGLVVSAPVYAELLAYPKATGASGRLRARIACVRSRSGSPRSPDSRSDSFFANNALRFLSVSGSCTPPFAKPRSTEPSRSGDYPRDPLEIKLGQYCRVG